jgi:hypothetical protein
LFLTAAFLVGLSLMIYSWLLSYPLIVVGANDYVFNHVSIFYWIGLELTLVSAYLAAINLKNKTLKCIIVIAMIMAMYSLSYYYYFLPGSDSQYFRGLNEHFIQTGDLTPNNYGRSYYQWPSFFLLNNALVSLTGLPLVIVDFLLFAVIGILLFTGLYKFASAGYGNLGIFAVLSYSVAMFYFLDYQAVSFSLAFALLILLFVLDKKPDFSRSKLVLSIVLFAACSFVHLFVPLFFVLYIVMMYFFARNRKYIRLALLYFVTYGSIQIFQAPISFDTYLRLIFTSASKYSSVAQSTLALSTVPLDSVVQIFSRMGIILATVVCSIGFIILFLRRKTTASDKAIFATGISYLVVGSVLYLVGLRGLPLAFIPTSIGIYAFSRGKNRFLKVFVLLIVSLFVFQPIHESFNNNQVVFQTKDAYLAEDFVLTMRNWSSTATYSTVFCHFRVWTYLEARIGTSSANFFTDYNPIDQSKLDSYEVIVYTAGLANSLSRINYTINDIIISNQYNLVYNNGYSSVLIK